MSYPTPGAIQLIIYLTQTSEYITFPDVPHRSKPRFLTATGHDIANIRLKGLIAPSELKVSSSESLDDGIGMSLSCIGL